MSARLTSVERRQPPDECSRQGRVGRPQTAQPHDGKSRNRSLWRPTRWRSVIDSSTQRKPRRSEQHHPGDGLLAMPGRSKSLEERRSGYVSHSNPVKSGEVAVPQRAINREAQA